METVEITVSEKEISYSNMQSVMAQIAENLIFNIKKDVKTAIGKGAKEMSELAKKQKQPQEKNTGASLAVIPSKALAEQLSAQGKTIVHRPASLKRLTNGSQK